MSSSPSGAGVGDHQLAADPQARRLAARQQQIGGALVHGAVEHALELVGRTRRPRQRRRRRRQRRHRGCRRRSARRRRRPRCRGCGPARDPVTLVSSLDEQRERAAVAELVARLHRAGRRQSLLRRLVEHLTDHRRHQRRVERRHRQRLGLARPPQHRHLSRRHYRQLRIPDDDQTQQRIDGSHARVVCTPRARANRA